MKNYKIQNGCHNCRFHLEDSDYDSDIEYHCNQGKTIDIKKVYYVSSLRLSKKKLLEKMDWMAKHTVEPIGICDYFEKQEDDF